MRNADLRFAAGVADTVKLVAAVRTVPHPGVNGIITRRRDVRRVSGRGRLRSIQRGVAIGHVAGFAEINRRSTVAPRTDESDGRVYVVHDHFVRLLAQWAHGGNNSASIEAVSGEKIQLIPVAVVFVH